MPSLEPYRSDDAWPDVLDAGVVSFSLGAAASRTLMMLRSPPLRITVEPAAGDDAGHAGLAVTSVDPEGPAAEKLVPEGAPQGPDIITYVNDVPVKTIGQLNEMLRATRPGEVVSLRVFNEQLGGSGGSRVVRMRVQ